MVAMVPGMVEVVLLLIVVNSVGAVLVILEVGFGSGWGDWFTVGCCY